ncbi:hypothetical protein DCCM_0877 [Desulfocucumis palustris]|uniref:DUF4258 domain-containing protein n=2 Tax=Desulfocucumis palustris TaxID=1898651 RepID=A0A2L2XFP0_9FIRM|nr:hypothetical protein DCCM_0877 [Desulfocucumis palustris]
MHIEKGSSMRVIITEHARKRLKDMRQDKITVQDIIGAATGIPGRIPTATRFRGFFAKSGRIFDIVAKDIPGGRLVITIIGK